jgi:Flp pilus assembly protein TadG
MRLIRFLRDTRGTAAAEFALWALVFVVPMASVVDLGVFAFQGMQVQTAAQAGVQAVRLQCRPYSPPFVTKCANLTTAATAGIQTTSLGTNVTIDSGWPKEGYYCANASNTLVRIGAAGTAASPPSKPSPYTCNSVVTGSGALPSDYVIVKVSANYNPVFPAVSVAGLLPSKITRVAWVRMQ